jgi:signal transduction histidine kinase
MAPAPRATRNTLLGVALAATIGLGGLFALEAVQVARSHQVSVGRFLEESAQAAAREVLVRVRDELDADAADLLGALTGVRASSPFEALPALDNLQKGAERTFTGCTAGTVRAFRLDFRTDSLTTAVPTGLRERDALVARVAADYRARYRPEWKAALLVTGSEMPVLYGVRFSEFRAPVAAYGVEFCARALMRIAILPALARPGLLAAGPRNVPQDSLMAAWVVDPTVAPLGASFGAMATGRERPDSTAPHATATLERLGGLSATVALRPASVGLLAVSPPSTSRVVLLVGLFVATVLLAAVTLRQLRREAALVRLRTDFTSSVSHELRTPLAQILLFGETLRLGRARTDDERRHAVDTIVEEGRRLQHLVDNLLQFDRAQRGAAPLATGPVPLAEAVAGARDAFGPLAAAARMSINVNVPAGLAVEADAAALRHVLLNFLDNAAKYGPAPQQVTVRATVHDGACHLAVEDQGPGIPAGDRDAIWLPFARLDRDRRGTRPGSGIGLSVVRELAARMGARAWVEDAPGGGARFVLSLPLAPTGPAPAAAPRPATPEPA